MSFNNEVLKLMNLKLQLNNVNLQFETFLSNLNNGLIPNLGVSLEEISLKLINLGIEMLNIEMQSKDISYFNSAQQIKNIGDMMRNISLQMTNMNSMKMNNINMGIPAPNMMNNNFNDFFKSNCLYMLEEYYYNTANTQALTDAINEIFTSFFKIYT